MKRLIAVIIAFVMVMGITVNAAATGTDAVGVGDHAADVTATYVEGNDQSPIVYYVELNWDGLDFTYYEESAPVWDHENHKYVDDGNLAGWDPNSKATVEIINHSNTEILAEFSYTPESGYEDVKMLFGTNNPNQPSWGQGSSDLYIASAEDGAAKTAVNTVTPSGTLPEGAENTKIGSIVIKIAQAPEIDRNFLESTYAKIITELEGLEWEVTSGDLDMLQSDIDTMMEAAHDVYHAWDAYEDGTLTQEELKDRFYNCITEWQEFCVTKVPSSR